MSCITLSVKTSQPFLACEAGLCSLKKLKWILTSLITVCFNNLTYLTVNIVFNKNTPSLAHSTKQP